MRTFIIMKTTLKFKQKDIAQKLGLSPSYLSEVLNKRRRPSWDVAKLLARETGTSPMVWMDGTEADLKNAIAAGFIKQ